MGDIGIDEDRTFIPCFAAPLCNPDPDSIRVETWVVAENPAREVLNCIHPTLDSEEKRKYVIEYVQKLIRSKLRLEVFSFGSVPLKTYLPDGDIDLTVLSTPNLDELLPSEVLRVLQEEEKIGNNEFEVKNTQFIDAEVKLVKCLVQDIVIDISCNQLGGLSTLCFLEQVDRLAGKDHLFKRSIMLIKAWCYYESRILGAHHGLISTYAMETLVLYIFHNFHASLNGPLEVLYRFLDYYAKFDWDNYCISLEGPVCKSSLNGLAVETLQNQDTDVLLDAEFRKNCVDMFIVPAKGAEADLQTFCLKNLNIIDPLKENNNLGRSVHKGNYFRIRSAFRYGARRLGKILEQPDTNIQDEIKLFFRNTLQRHQPNYGLDSTLIFPANGFITLSVSSTSEPYYEDDLYSTFSNDDLDDYMNGHNSPLLTESNLEEEQTALELWMQRGGSELLDMCVNGHNNGNTSDNLSFDANEKAASDDSIWETDLTGDYDAHVRNLLYGQGCHGYALSTALVWASTNGNRGTGPYIPVMSCNEDGQPPARERGRGRGPPVSNGAHLHRARIGSGEPNFPVEVNSAANGSANQPRKLEFGSFRSMPENLCNGQSLKVDGYGSKQGRIIEDSLYLKDEDEFPPLSG